MTASISLSRRLVAIATAVALSITVLLPMFSGLVVQAAEMQNRSVTVDKAYTGATDVSFTFQYDINNVSETKAGIRYEFCDAALGACTMPAGMDVQTANTHDAQSGWATDATAFAPVSEAADVGECTANTNSYMLCYSRDEAVATGVTGGTATHTISGITAPSGPDTVYVRVFLYENDDFLNANQLVFNGTQERGIVAAAFTNQLTVSATVAEYLEFCVGTQDADTNGNSTDNCSDITGTTMNIGTIPFNGICYSALGTANNPCENDDGREGYAMVATNAANGVTISYYAEQDSSNGNNNKDGSLKIQGADCTATVGDTTDQCFESAGTTSIGFTAGTENFGMTIREVNSDNGGLTSNVARDQAYNGDGVADAEGCADAGVTPDLDCWAWDETGAVDEIASSPSVVDDEMLVLTFAAAASLTTPTGTYAVTSTYIATPTF